MPSAVSQQHAFRSLAGDVCGGFDAEGFAAYLRFVDIVDAGRAVIVGEGTAAFG